MSSYPPPQGGMPPYQPPYQPPQPQYGYPPVPQFVAAPPTSGAAVAGLVFGILSYVFLPLIGSIIAVICGHVALGQIKSSGGRVGGSGMAIAALVLGYLQLAGWVILLLILIVIGGIIGSTSP